MWSYQILRPCVCQFVIYAWSVPCHILPSIFEEAGLHSVTIPDISSRRPPRSPHVPFVEHLPSCVGGTRKPQDRSSPKTGAWCVFGKVFILLVVSSQNVKFDKQITHASICVYIYTYTYTLYIIHYTSYIIHYTSTYTYTYIYTYTYTYNRIYNIHAWWIEFDSLHGYLFIYH